MRGEGKLRVENGEDKYDAKEGIGRRKITLGKGMVGKEGN